MPKTQTVTTNFSAGELSPKVEGRIDLAQYYKGARKAQNTTIAAQGGAYKRFGMGYKASLNSAGAGGLYNAKCANFKLIPFTTSQDEEFLVVLSNTGSLYVYDTNGLLLHTVEDTPFKGSYIESVSYATKDDFLLIVHPEVYPMKLTRISSLNSSFTFTSVSFEAIPTYEWSNTLTVDQTTQLYTLSFNDLDDGDIFQLEYNKAGSNQVYNYISSPTALEEWDSFTADGMGFTLPFTSPNIQVDIAEDPNGVYTFDGIEVTDNDEDGAYYTGISQDLDLIEGATYTYSFYLEQVEVGAVILSSGIHYEDGTILNLQYLNYSHVGSRISGTFVHKGGSCKFGLTSTQGVLFGNPIIPPVVGWVMVTGGTTVPDFDSSANDDSLSVATIEYKTDDYQTGTTNAEEMISALNTEFNSVGYDVEGTYNTISRGGITESTLSYVTFTPNSNLTPEVELSEVGTSNSVGGSVYLEKYYDEDSDTANTADVWSAARGYPATVAFHKGRLWFGGSKSLPQTIWASKSYEYFNFSTADESNIVDNDYIDRTIDSTVASTITSMYSSTRLIITTSSTPFTISSSTGVPTPNDLDITQEDGGAGELAPMVRMDNSVFYLQDGGSELNNIGYDYTSETYATYPNALLSNHLINNPKEICVTSGGGEFNTETLFLRNEDGSVSSYRRLEAQKVANWSSFTTQGFVDSLTSIKDTTFFIVKRDGVSGSVYTLEALTESDIYMDCYSHYSGVGEINELSGLDVYSGQTVDILCDGWWSQGEVDTSGNLTLPFACREVTIGYPIQFELETMPVNVDTQQGSIRFAKKRITRSQIDIHDSFGFDIEYLGRVKTITDFTTGFEFSAPKPQTRLLDTRWLGWSKEDTTLKITSDKPYPVNVRSLELEVKFS